MDVGREACRAEMEVRGSMQKDGCSDSVAALHTEEFVLVPHHADATKGDETPHLKVFSLLEYGTV